VQREASVSNLWTVAASGDTIKIMEGQPVNWRKPQRSTYNGNCVEVGRTQTVIAIRDTLNRDGVTLQFTTDVWETFTGSLRKRVS
jgi:hypothetical protein